MWTWFVPSSPLQIWYCCESSWSLRGTENSFACADICNCIYMRGQQLLFLVHWDEIECIFCMQAFQRVHSEKIFPCLEVKILRLLPWCGSLWEIFVAPVGTMSMCVSYQMFYNVKLCFTMSKCVISDQIKPCSIFSPSESAITIVVREKVSLAYVSNLYHQHYFFWPNRIKLEISGPEL